MATFEDLKESCDKFVKQIEHILDDENLGADDCCDAIETEKQSFKGYLDDVVNDHGVPEEVEDYEKGGIMEDILKDIGN